MIIFDGKSYALTKEEELKSKVSKLKTTPKLVVILVGDDPASILYANLKKKVAERIGIDFKVLKFPSKVLSPELIKTIETLNKDAKIHGIMVQLPLPPSLKSKTKNILESISPQKDIDGLTSKSPFMPATTKAIIRILKVAKEKKDLGDEKIVVVGAKGMVGKSVVKELKNLKYKVTGVDIETKDLKTKTKKADILISATGKSNLIKGNMVKNRVAIIDVGSPKGDVLFNEVAPKANFLTPVPGGVGPVTIVSLLENLVQSMYNSAS